MEDTAKVVTPKKKAQRGAQKHVSERTTRLTAQRQNVAKASGRTSVEARCATRKVKDSAPEDWQEHVSGVTEKMEVAAAANDRSTLHKLVNQLTKKKSPRIQPSTDETGGQD